MGFSTAEVSAVRALPVVVGVDEAGRWQIDPGFVEVVFQSSASGKYHQVYLDGRLAGVTQAEDERTVTVAACESAASVIEVVAVDSEDRLQDFSASLTGFSDLQGARVNLSWFGGRYLGDTLDHFDVYGGPAGAVDDSRPLNAEPITAFPDGVNLGGFGSGGCGRGGWGRSAMAYSFLTPKFVSGQYTFEVLAVDSSGNSSGGPAARIEVEVRSLPRPPGGLHVAAYTAGPRTVTLSWTASLDV
jgi:hypothetical protein